MSICEHALNAKLTPPSSSTLVYKDECTQCFDNQDMTDGIDVCLSCFNGGCTDGNRQHAQMHAMKSGHHLTLNIRRIPKPSEQDDNNVDGVHPAKLAKLEIKEERDAEKYEYKTFVRCWGCAGAQIEDGLENIEPVVQAVIHSVEASKNHEIKAWAEEVLPCQHFECLDQEPESGFGLDKLHSCGSCNMCENLWMCLSCGHVGCGRRQYDGSGGNNHAVEHFEKTGHKVSCKLGTITPEGTADAYCYVCDDNRVDPYLSQHLEKFGINVLAQQKTEKSVAELQLEQNLKFDFSMTTADGQQLEPVAGPGLTGLKNLGNSCYMASVIQCVFGTDRFRDRYFPTAADHFASCANLHPAQCLQCQLHKLADGLWSGRYAHIEKDGEGNVKQQHGISPAHFKSILGKDHYEFSTMRQQDAFEFFQHLTKQINIDERHIDGGNMDPTKIFDFKLEERLQCKSCGKVRYKNQPASNISIPVIKRTRSEKEDGSGIQNDSSDDTNTKYEPVALSECLDLLTQDEIVDGYNCPHCNKPTEAAKSMSFVTFPKVLIAQVRRFELVNWVPQKLNIPVSVPLEQIDIEKYRGTGIQPNEEPLPEDPEEPDNSTSQQQAVDETVVVQLESMGFPHAKCVKAVKKSGNVGATAAMNWLFEHMDDADIDEPEEEPNTAAQQTSGVDATAVEQLVAMGFAQAQAEKALRATGGDANRALDRLLSAPDDTDMESGSPSGGNEGSGDDVDHKGIYELTGFVSHKGSSVHCGHYISNVRHGLGSDSKWFLFNDEKVVTQPEPQPEQAYIYMFTRCD